MIARVVTQLRGDAYVVLAADGEHAVGITGRLRHTTVGVAAMPAVGDEVEVDGTVITSVLPRRTALIRRGRGRDGQVLAANVDDVFIVVPLHRDVAPLEVRLQQYVALARATGVAPHLVLTKADVCPDVRAQVTRATRAAPDVPVLVTSSVRGEGIAEIEATLAPGRTGVLLGPSGAGKSTLINALVGAERLLTSALDGLGQGRHASVRRELVVLPKGGWIIDTPGLREVDAWLGEEVVALTYPDIAALADRCRFRDCAHESEPGCEVQAALGDGRLDPARLAGLRRLEADAAHADRSPAAARARSRAIGRAARKL